MQSAINDAYARLETELADAHAALNLAREGAEDVEAELAEARRELALETGRADDAERELAQLLAGEERQPDAGGSLVVPAVQPCAAPPSLVDRPEVTAMAAELIALMAKNDRAAAPPPKKRQKAKQSAV